MSQMHFMGERPAGWLEELAADKARRRRKQRMKITICLASGLLLISAA